METDATGTSVRTFGHLPFGETWYEPTGTDKMKFTSYESDSGAGETGLNYAQFRQHSSGLGRFMSADLLTGNPGAPQSLNRYTYAMNDPVNQVDPLGLFTMCFGPVHSDDGLRWYAGGRALCWDVGDMGEIGGGGGGGGGPAAHNDLRAQALRALLTNPDCRNLFGGLTNALRALTGTHYFDYSPGMSNPDPAFITPNKWPDITAVMANNGAAVTAYNPRPGRQFGDTFLNVNFYTDLAPGFSTGKQAGQMTIIMHEMEHIVTQDLTPDSNYDANYTDINNKCSPRDVPTLDAPMPDFPGGTTT